MQFVSRMCLLLIVMIVFVGCVRPDLGDQQASVLLQEPVLTNDLQVPDLPEVDPPTLNVSQDAQFGSFYEYFLAFLGGGEETRRQVKIFTFPENVVPLLNPDTERPIILEFETLSHTVIPYVYADWEVRNQPQPFYLLLERPSACAAQVIFGVVELEDCEVQVTREFYGPFSGNIRQLLATL